MPFTFGPGWRQGIAVSLRNKDLANPKRNFIEFVKSSSLKWWLHINIRFEDFKSMEGDPFLRNSFHAVLNFSSLGRKWKVILPMSCATHPKTAHLNAIALVYVTNLETQYRNIYKA